MTLFQGWTTAPGRDAQLEYRLSIYHARVNDTGIYTCTTPKGRSHKIRIVVKDVQCPELKPSFGLQISDTSLRHLNAQVHFSCTNGNSLIGESPLQCLYTGKWSHKMPACFDVICPESIVKNAPPTLIATADSFGVGSEVKFNCATGYELSGPNSAQCGPDGKWSVTSPPRCHPIKCSNMDPPQNGYLTSDSSSSSSSHSGPFVVGDMVKFHCKPGYMMEGSLPMSKCNPDGQWSPPNAPKCVKACMYPGSAIGGRISKVSFFYKVDEVVIYECAQGRKLVGTKRIVCLESGIWSGPVPMCVRE